MGHFWICFAMCEPLLYISLAASQLCCLGVCMCVCVCVCVCVCMCICVYVCELKTHTSPPMCTWPWCTHEVGGGGGYWDTASGLTHLVSAGARVEV